MESSFRSTPTLMRQVRGVYAQSIRAHLHAMGIDDLPRNGVFILTAIDNSAPQQDLAAELGITKQAVSQLIDILVNRGYLDRTPDPDDRRRISLELTERGQQAVDVAGDGVEAIDAKLAERVPPEQIEAMRSGLAALAEIKAADTAAGIGRPRPARQFRRFSPIFPVSDLAAALAHYSALGFESEPYEDGDDYGFATREGAQLHLAAHPAHDGHDTHDHAASAYLYVRDADELYAEWSRAAAGGTTRPVHDTPYQLREGSHTDPDGNLIRFGSFTDD
jgi:DNA-binding MarR family transcriptional regulator/uncharacterized glyoxalase superfamily protein PhnB